jgi:hypothetical protein
MTGDLVPTNAWHGYQLDLPHGDDWPCYANGKPYWPEHELQIRGQEWMDEHLASYPIDIEFLKPGKRIPGQSQQYAMNRLRLSGFSQHEIGECRLALRVVERQRWQDGPIPLTEIEAVLFDWLAARRKPDLPRFVAAHPARRLLLF